MIEIIPAILTDNIEELREKIGSVEGKAERVQIDIIDGEFADNKTIDPSQLEGITTKLNLDYHLMVIEPIKWIDKCVKAGADRIIGHIEEMTSQEDFVSAVEDAGVSAGLAVDLDTPISDLDKKALKRVDVVLIMSVRAGFGGQEFDNNAIDKIYNLNKMRNEESFPFAICDDGGVTAENVDDSEESGVDEVAVGQRIFKGDLGDNLEKLFRAAYE